jgi:hypothetical protein
MEMIRPMLRAPGRRHRRVRADISVDDLGRFLSVVLDGFALQRAFGFQPPERETLVRLVWDALKGPAAPDVPA